MLFRIERMTMKLKTVSLLAGSMVMVQLLAGCAPLLVGGAAATTATVVTDRRSTGAIVNDEVLEKKIYLDVTEAIKATPNHITVTSYDRKVLLTGEVATQETKDKAGQIAAASLDVDGVFNELAVRQPVSATQRLSDSLLATKVRGVIVGTKKISLNQMKVVVDRNIAYLMGILSPTEAAMTKKAVAGVDGVKQVVALFTVESEEMIRLRMNNNNKNNQQQNKQTD